MGALSAAFTAAFLGPNGNGTNGDGTPYRPKPADAAALGAAADNAIPNAQDLSGETTAREGAVAALSTRVDGVTEAYEAADVALGARIDGEITTREALEVALTGETTDRETADADLQEQLVATGQKIQVISAAATKANGRLDVLEPAVTALGTRADGVDRTLGQLGQDRDTLQADLSGKLDTLQTLVGTAALAARDRVGENLFLFTSGLSGAGPVCPPLPSGGVVVTPFGQVYRATGPQIIARRAPIWIEPGRIQALRFAVSRFSLPSDPDNDVVRCGIACLDQTGALLSTLAVRDFVGLSPVDGLQVVSTRFPSQPGDPILLQPPAGAVLFRPYLQGFGLDGITDYVLLADQDVTDASWYAPDVSGIVAQVTALATRLAAIDPLAAGVANGLATLDSTGTIAQLPMLKSAFMLAAAQVVPGALELLDNAVTIQGDETISILHRSPYLAAGDPWVTFAQATLGLTAAQVATILAAIGSPSQRSGYVPPNPVFDLNVTRAAVIDAARVRFATIPGAGLVAFRTAMIGDEDKPDGSWTAYYADEGAPVGGLLYALMLSYLISPAPGPALSQQAAVAQLTAIWAAAASIPS